MTVKTLREHLAYDRLASCNDSTTATNNSSHNDWPALVDGDIKSWDDFALPTFEYIYPRLLDTKIDCPSIQRPFKFATKITGEDAVQHMLWLTVGNGLGHILEQMAGELHREIWLGPSSLCNLGTDVSRSNKPDWHGSLIDRVQNGVVPTCKCPGDTKKAKLFNTLGLTDHLYLLEDEDLLPIDQAAHYARLAQTPYAFIVTEEDFVALRVSYEDMAALPQERAPNPYRTAAPTTFRFSGSSQLSDAFSTMSFGPSRVKSVEVGVFPWRETRQGLTGLGAWFWLLVLATEPRAACSFSYYPLNTIQKVEEVVEGKRDRRGHRKTTTKIRYIPVVTGKRTKRPPPRGFNQIKLEDTSQDYASDFEGDQETEDEEYE